MRDLGQLKYFVGMHIVQDRKNRTIYVDQEAYATKVLECFGMVQCKPKGVPIKKGLSWEKGEPDDGVEQQYQAIIGSLMNLAVLTQPDLAIAISIASRVMSCATEEHLRNLETVLRYLKKTKDVKLKLGGVQSSLNGYYDSDWGGDLNDRKSTSGYILKLNYSTVDWHTGKQRNVATSSTEAEYYALADYAKAKLGLRVLLMS
jgi:hypothetical protein